ncbi:Protein THYLAKOID FORMATION1, chloroplastic, partial [Linum perenne]
PTVAETKLNFLKAYKKPIPSIYNNVLQELIVQQHLIRNDANKLEEWARAQTATSLVEFPSREGEVEGLLKAIAERAAAGKFSYSRFFAVGLFRLLELSNATEPTVLEKLCAALNVDKRSVDRDLDVYRNLLSKLVQAKELLKEYVAREKKKREERTTESQKASEAVKNCVAQPNYIG